MIITCWYCYDCCFCCFRSHQFLDTLLLHALLFPQDHYKEFGGDAAAYSAPANDLQGVKAYAGVDMEGLYTLGTVVLDYRGFRVTAQSIIPGILDREQEQSVVYGSIDFGKTVVVDKKYQELLQKTAQVRKPVLIHMNLVLLDALYL